MKVLWLAILAVGGWILWRVFFRKKTDLEQHFTELEANRQLGNEATGTEIDIAPSISYLGSFPLAEVVRTPMSTQPSVPIATEFLPRATGEFAYLITPKDKQDFKMGDNTSASHPDRVFGTGALDVWGNEFAPSL